MMYRMIVVMALVGLLVASSGNGARAAIEVVDSGGQVDGTPLAFEEPRAGSWVFGDSLRVSVRLHQFRVPQDGQVCVSASWSIDEEGDADWTCYTHLTGGVLTTEVFGARNATYGTHSIAAMLVGNDQRPIGNPTGVHVYLPARPTQVRPGEWHDLRRYMSGKVPKLTDQDHAALTFYAPTLFSYIFRTFKFLTITRPLTGTILTVADEADTVDVEVGVSLAPPAVPADVRPEVCVTVDHRRHTCHGLTDQFVVPSLAPGHHVISVQVRAREGHYYGAPSTVDIYVKTQHDDRTASQLRAALPMPLALDVTLHADALPADDAAQLVAVAERLGLEPVGVARDLPGPGDAEGPCVLDRVEVVYVSDHTLLDAELGDQFPPARAALRALKQAALDAAGIVCARLDDCVEEAVEISGYAKDDWHEQRYTHVRAECERDLLRVPSQGRGDAALLKNFRVPDCDEVEETAKPRTHTVLVYLNSLPSGAGGQTYFPMLALAVQPTLGTAVVMHQCATADCSVPASTTLFADGVVEWDRITKYVATVHITAPPDAVEDAYHRGDDNDDDDEDDMDSEDMF